ncbi:MAG: DUF6247 family protein [Pseudonocardiaceae bacterium]
MRPGAAPRAVRAALLPADRIRFDVAYEAALAGSRESLDLTGLFKALEHWRQVAVLQSDSEGYRRVVRRAAEALTGEEIPADEPLELTRAKAGHIGVSRRHRRAGTAADRRASRRGPSVLR